jgi:hypothetical protein
VSEARELDIDVVCPVAAPTALPWRCQQRRIA